MEKVNFACSKRAGRSLSRCPKLRSPSVEATAAAAVENAGGSFSGEEAGGIRVKIVLSKEELRQLMAALSTAATPAVAEELLQGVFLRRRCVKSSECSGKVRRWRPELRSIPEEQF